jgi:hypothetical protein
MEVGRKFMAGLFDPYGPLDGSSPGANLLGLGNALVNPPGLAGNGAGLNFVSGSLAPPPSLLGSAANALLEPSRPSLAEALYGTHTKRKVYFSFRFEDVMRVNVVRNVWCIDHPNSSSKRSFYDRSIWDKSYARYPESLKSLMRDAVTQSSAICVLVGTNTWKGPWVRYEIARAVVDNRGLLAVHINGLKHHQRQAPDLYGANPLDYLGIYHDHNGCYYIYEKIEEVDRVTWQGHWVWRLYENFKDTVDLPCYIPSIQQGFVTPLSYYTMAYDYANGDSNNIGAWIDEAARVVGR